ncbi:MAG: homoserine dehydrogenase [Bulleidia sp.]
MKIGLLGHGVVGSGVAEIIDQGTTAEVRNLEVARMLVRTQQEVTEKRITTEVSEILEDPEIDVIAECMGGLEPAHTYVRTALEHGKSVVSSNKKMLAAYYGELMEIAEKNHAMLRMEAAVGGGIPWMENLMRIRRIEPIDSFRGIFNGTTNYILSAMNEEQKEFIETLKEAQAAGYAERDPADDIDGLDVRYKVALTCAQAFDALVDPSEIPAFGIRKIRREDLLQAEKLNRTIKLIGQAEDHGDSVMAMVMPVMVKDRDYLSRIPCNLNGIESFSRTLGKAGFTGQGAGSLPTAHAVVQDLIDVSEGRKEAVRSLKKKPVSCGEREEVYYIRTSVPEVFAEVTAEKLDMNCLLTEKAAWKKLEALLQQADDPDLFLAEVQA